MLLFLSEQVSLSLSILSFIVLRQKVRQLAPVGNPQASLFWQFVQLFVTVKLVVNMYLKCRPFLVQQRFLNLCRRDLKFYEVAVRVNDSIF